MPVLFSRKFLTLVLFISSLSLCANSTPQNVQKELNSNLTPLSDNEIPTPAEMKNKIPTHTVSTGISVISGAIKEEGDSISTTGLRLSYENRHSYEISHRASINYINQQNLLLQIDRQWTCCHQWGDSFFYSAGIADNFVPTETIQNLLQLKRYKLTTSFGKSNLFIDHLQAEVQLGWGLIGFALQINFTYQVPLNITRSTNF